MWFLLSLVGALGDAGYYALVKKFIKKTDRFVLAAGIYFFIALLTFFLLFFYDKPELNSTFFLSLLITVLLNFIASILIYKALAISDLSLVQPMKAFTPLLLIFSSFLILRELPTIPGIIGIVLIVIGSYILYQPREHLVSIKHFFSPFGQMYKNKGLRLMMIVVLLFGITPNFDKIIVQNSTPIFALFASSLGLGLCFLILIFFKRNTRTFLSSFKTTWWKYLLVAIVCVAGGVALNTALNMQIVPYVTSIKRFSVLFAVLLGYFIFQEKLIKRRLLGAGVMVLGSILIILF